MSDKTGIQWFDEKPDSVTIDMRAAGLQEPLRWRKPRRVLVRRDLFQPCVPDERIDSVFAVMALARKHTFLVVTENPERMRAYLEDRRTEERTARASVLIVPNAQLSAKGIEPDLQREAMAGWATWPLPNVWLGVSVKDQETADKRIPLLLRTLAAERFVSYEPALGPVDFRPYVVSLDWIIVGGESGPGARPCDVAWIRNTVAACREAGVAVFVKQLGAVVVQTATEWREGLPPEREWPFPQVIEAEPCGGPNDDWPGMVRFGSRGGEWMHVLGLRDPKGGDMAEWPEDLRVREFPAVGGDS